MKKLVMQIRDQSSSITAVRAIIASTRAAEKTTCKSSDEVKNLVIQIRDAVIPHRCRPGDHCIDQRRREDHMQEQ